MRLAALLLLLVSAAPALADGLVEHVDGRTLDKDGKEVRFTGLLIGKDGRVAKLFDDKDKPPKALDFKLDGKGRVLLPGKVLCCLHLMDMALAEYQRDPSMDGRPIQPRERDSALHGYQAKLLAEGVTAVTDMATTIGDWSVYRRAGDSGRLRVRIISYGAGVDTMMTVAGSQPTPWLYNGRLRMAGLALTDAAPFDDARIRNQISRGAMDGFQVLIEPDGAEATEHALAAIEEVAETYKGDRRWRLQADYADAARLDRTGTLALPLADPARAAFAETEIGGLMPGMRADFRIEESDGSLRELWMDGARVWTKD